MQLPLPDPETLWETLGPALPPETVPMARACPALERCDQEMSKRTLAASHKVREEASKKEARNHFEPCDVQVSLPRRVDE